VSKKQPKSHKTNGLPTSKAPGGKVNGSVDSIKVSPPPKKG
jgi:hypothetical protein